jgi:membrane-bound lytic murein transglycosylase B
MRRAAAFFGWTLIAAFGGLAPMTRAQDLAPTFESSGDPAFDSWRADFARRAIASGRSPKIVRSILTGVAPDPRVVQADQNQPEFVRPVWDYIARAVAPRRVAAGQAKRAELAPLFSQIQARYGVDPDIITGIWAIETNFGQVALPHDAVAALATLAAEGRRRAQFEGYLLSLMQMVERGYANAPDLKSSWAGALGQPQFMPDIYLSDAVDLDGDGRRDIWTNTGDALASIANYLARRGWSASGPVFDEAKLPTGFNFALADGTSRPVSEWEALGVTRITGGGFGPEVRTLSAQLFLPAGAHGPALLLFPNFRVIRAYNPSDRYALSVALLARGFAGQSGIVAAWPVEQGALQRADMLELQTLLQLKGYQVSVDGLFGNNTRSAVRAYQQTEGLPADGWPTRVLLDRIRGAASAPVANPLEAARDSARDLRTSASIREIQQALNQLGYKIGKPNGIAGPRTRAAIGAYERKLGLSPTGRATTFVLSQVRKELKARRSPRAAAAGGRT